jgi:hypothetical protein
MFFSLPKSGVPRPVTGSQPGAAYLTPRAHQSQGRNRKRWKRVTYAESWRAASRRVPGRNIVQTRHTDRVEHRVEEAEWVLARCDQSVVQQRNYARKGRRGRGCAGDQHGDAPPPDEEVGGLRRDIWVGL